MISACARSFLEWQLTTLFRVLLTFLWSLERFHVCRGKTIEINRGRVAESRPPPVIWTSRPEEARKNRKTCVEGAFRARFLSHPSA
jgi:hypothetical protein